MDLKHFGKELIYNLLLKWGYMLKNFILLVKIKKMILTLVKIAFSVSTVQLNLPVSYKNIHIHCNASDCFQIKFIS